MKFTSVKERIFLALDVPGADEARSLIEHLGDKAVSYKIGLQLFCAAGPDFVRELADSGKNVFLDLKFHDIPNTVSGAVKAAASLGARMINLHCSGGSEMLKAARNALKGNGQTALLGVTVLTSLDDENLKELGMAYSTEGQVMLLARLAKEAGLDGVVCSPKEIELLRNEFGDDFLLVTPGIRPAWSETGDQKRVTTPVQALQAGASAIVIGRPVTAAADPATAMSRLLDECQL